MVHDEQETRISAGAVFLPAPTAWPLILALGFALVFAGLVTSYSISVLGAGLAIAGIVGWARQVLPVEQHEQVIVVPHKLDLEIEHRRVARIQVDESHRALLPLQTYTVSSGILGGFAGGTAMILLAEIYGVVAHHSMWYAVNLLGGAGVANWPNPTDAELDSFRFSALVIAIIIHTCTSFLVGLLYGALLPILPRHPVILGGLIGPALWTGLLHSTLGLINPFFDSHVNWWWFAVSQIGFGVVAGITVVKFGHVKRMRGAPLPVRLGLEMSEHHPQKGSEGE
jgi:hypothetical protein